MEQPIRLKKLNIDSNELTLESLQRAMNKLMYGNQTIDGEIVEPLKELPEPTKLDKQISAAKKYKIDKP